jgi:restriction endonuclease S subunit
MTLIQFTTDFKSIGKQGSLRLDFGYRCFFDIQEANIFSNKNSIKLKSILKPVETKKILKGELEKLEILVDIGNIERRFNNLISCEEVDEIGSDKNVLQEGDIIIPKMQPRMGNFFLNLEHKRYIGSSELLEYKITTESRPHFIYYLFTTQKFLSDLAKLESGKTQRRVNPTDLLEIKIPYIPKFNQDQIVAEIEPTEKKIKELKNAIKKPQIIIDQVFARELGFNLEKFEKEKEKKFFETDFLSIFKNSLLRLSSHFHHKKLENIEEKLKDKNLWVPVNSIFKMSGGKRIPKGKTFSNEETDYFYLRPNEVSVYGVDKNNVPFLSTELYNRLKKYKIISGELCVSIVGTVGKVALISTEKLGMDKENLILSENFVKLAPKKNINNLFYFYYFWSFIFQAQADQEYTITSIKALGIDKWNYIKVPSIPLSEQEKIASEIKNELDKQEAMKKLIEKERDRIDEIIVSRL